MIDQIVKTARTTSFDFRRWASPEDPLSGSFEDWVDYYRLKYAIAAELQPRSILEIGVRYGYSARTFLSACPEATFLGIDNQSEDYGGAGPGAADWARRLLSNFEADLLQADSQRMSSFPGGEYDLIHVDGQQDEEGIRADLDKALSQARFILVDGFTWMAENHRAASRFLFERRRDIEYYGVIPGYAGELLIRTSESYRRLAQEARTLKSSSPTGTTTHRFDRDECLAADDSDASHEKPAPLIQPST